MRELPILVSVPHSGLWIPQEVDDLCALRPDEIVADADIGAAEIFHPLQARVVGFVSSPIARSIVDVDRSEGQHRRWGSAGRRTCWGAPVYHTQPSAQTIDVLLQRYHRPYHERLRSVATRVAMGFDLHTMAEVGPPMGRDPGQPRPKICVGGGRLGIREEWYQELVLALQEAFELPVSLDLPFQGGYTVRSRPGGIPWVQITLARTPWASDEDKAAALFAGLRRFCDQVLVPAPRPVTRAQA